MDRLGVSESDFRGDLYPLVRSRRSESQQNILLRQLLHVPTGLAVKCQQERSQALNRFLARRILLDRIERIQTGVVIAEKQRIEKLKRQKRRRSRRAQEKILEQKHIQSEKKSLRAKVKPTDDPKR